MHAWQTCWGVHGLMSVAATALKANISPRGCHCLSSSLRQQLCCAQGEASTIKFQHSSHFTALCGMHAWQTCWGVHGLMKVASMALKANIT